MARPRSAILRKDADIAFAGQTVKQTVAFEEPRRRGKSPPRLALPKFIQPYRLETDPSQYQFDCTLLQHQQDDTLLAVGFSPKTLKFAEQTYCVTECECVAIVRSMRTLCVYLEGTRFAIRTEHDALRWILNLTDSTVRLAPSRLLLSEFDIAYVVRRVNRDLVAF